MANAGRLRSDRFGRLLVRRRESCATESVVHVDERDFRIVVRPKRVPAGDIQLLVRNHGPVTHELIVVRGLRSHVPLRLERTSFAWG
jgi:hypothetical protein